MFCKNEYNFKVSVSSILKLVVVFIGNISCIDVISPVHVKGKSEYTKYGNFACITD